MATEKITYWVAVSLVALFMGNQLVGKLDDGNCLANKARVVAERISGQATHLMAMAEVAMGRTSSRFDRAQAAMAMAQMHMAAMQTQFARGEAACARLEAGRARMVVLQELRVPVVHPRVQMVMPQPPAVPGTDPI